MCPRYPLRKFFALLFASYFLLAGLFPGTNFRQLRLITNLADHFQAHRDLATARGEAADLLSFLWEHVVAPSEHDELPGHSHAGLPFQGLQASVQLYVASLAFILPRTEEVRQKHIFSEESFLGTDLHHDIFHPPCRI